MSRPIQAGASAKNITTRLTDSAAVFGATLLRLRKAHGLTQEQLAWRTEVDQTFISALERGLKEPCLKTLMKLSQAFDLSLVEFMSEFEQAMPVIAGKGRSK